MSETDSIETVIMNNLSARRHFLQRWGPPLLVFGVAAMLISRDSSDKPLISSTIMRTLNERRELYTPYDKSTYIELPAWTNSIVDVWDPIDEKHTPLFWYIPKAGGSTLNKVFSHCLGLTLASNKGAETGNTVR